MRYNYGNIAMRRKSRGLTQESLAEAMNKTIGRKEGGRKIHKQQVGQWERGEAIPLATTFAVLCHCLDSTQSYFIEIDRIQI